MKTYTFDILTLDIWGNEHDGYEVNNAFKTGYQIELSEDCTDDDIFKAIKDITGWTITPSYYEIENQGDLSMICIDNTFTGEPALQLAMTYESIQEYYK